MHLAHLFSGILLHILRDVVAKLLVAGAHDASALLDQDQQLRQRVQEGLVRRDVCLLFPMRPADVRLLPALWSIVAHYAATHVGELRVAQESDERGEQGKKRKRKHM